MTKSITYSVLLFLICPMFILLSYLFHNTDFTFLTNANFQRYILNTLLLTISVGIITAVIGTASAILVTFFDFPGKKIFQILFFLPLAFPAYIVAFTYAHLFEFAGPIQTFLRNYLGVNYFPNIKSLGGAIFVMSFSFYPYIYMLARANFISLGYMINTARVMGKSIYQIICEVILPVSKSAIISGVTLVIMEVAADFGTPRFLSIDTFTTGIYRTWFLLNDYPSAARLTCMILIFIFLILYIERGMRKNKIYSGTVHDNNQIYQWKISGKLQNISAYSFCIMIPLIGFFIPLIPLIFWSIETNNLLDINLFVFFINSVSISSFASLIIVMLSVIFAYCLRNKIISASLIRIVNMGYAVPSSIIATGVMIFLAALSRYVNFVFYQCFGLELNVMLIGTIFALLYAYMVRFLSVSTNTLESGFGKIPREIDWISSTLGHSGWKTCLSVHMPILLKTIITAFLLVFIDIVKELSATLIVRPFNFETIATRTYDLIMDERYREAAFPALIIMSIGILSILLMTKFVNLSLRRNNYS
ncbi:MAG: iron ABC transporter permease [Rickettsiaceae bacterium H1]|nr:iron ABC transporter permease [Rickettsiaceae bacterium H1]